MKLNNLSRLTALLLALTMLLPTFAVAEDGTGFGNVTQDYLDSLLETATLIDELIAADYCETCAKDVGSAGLSAWPISGYDCLYKHLDDLSPSEAYDMLIAYYNAGTAEGDSLWKAYINSHNNHVINAANAGSTEYPAVICDCAQPVLQPGNGKHDATCPWVDEEYVTSTTLTDQNGTGITVTGDIPAGVGLKVIEATANDAALSAMLDTEKYSEVMSVVAYDITLEDANGKWNPKDHGTTVTVTVPNAYDTNATDPLIGVYHLLATPEDIAAGTGTFEALYSADNQVNLANGSVSFMVDSFSTYYVAQLKQYDASIVNGDIYYMLPGSTLRLTLSNQRFTSTYVPTEGSGITVNTSTTGECVITTTPTAVDAQFTVTANGSTVTVYVGASHFIAMALEDDDHPYSDALFAGYSDPVGLELYIGAIRNPDNGMPNEPAADPYDSYYYITKNGNNYNATSGSGVCYFHDPAKDIIKLDIYKHEDLSMSTDGTATIGLFDPTGVAIKQYVQNVDWDLVAQTFATSRTCRVIGENGTQGEIVTTANLGNYVFVPYVIKLQLDSDYQRGWHIDGCFVPRAVVTLDYDINIPAGLRIVTTGVGAPNIQQGTSPATFPIGEISNLKSGDKIDVQGSSDESIKYEFTFVGWNTQPDGKGTMYHPDGTNGPDEITIEENEILYAIWDSNPAMGTGVLRIEKKVVLADGAEADPDATFKFTLSIKEVKDGALVDAASSYPLLIYNADGGLDTSSTIRNGGTLNLKDGQYAVISDLPANNDGTEPNITVTEDATDGYTTSWDDGITENSSTSVKIEGGRRSEITCTNTKAPSVGSLTITKEVVGIEGDIPDGTSFSFTVTGNTDPIVLSAANGWTHKIENLAVGTYTVSETVANIENYNFVAAKIGSDTLTLTNGTYSTEVTIEKDKTASVNFTNVYEKATADLTITKEVVGFPAGLPAQEFTVKVSLPEKEGGYTYIKGGVSGKVPANGELTIMHGETIVIEDVVIGSEYTVTEAAPTYFDVSYDNNNQSGTIGTNGNTVAITNTYKPGSLTITKNVEAADDVDVSEDAFTFTVTLNPAVTGDFDYTVNGSKKTAEFTNGVGSISLKARETATFTTLPHGVQYTVTEQTLNGYVLDKEKTSGTTGSITNDTTAIFTNIHQFGNLVISKTVSGNDAPGGEFVFNVTLTNGNLNGDYGNVTFSNGTAEVEVKLTVANGETSFSTIVGLPAGTKYTVTETAKAGYTTTSTNATGTIAAGDTVTAVFTNTYSVGNLAITKTVEGATAPENASFQFQVTFIPIVTPSTPLAESYDYTVTQSKENTTITVDTGKVASGEIITLQNGQTATISGIQADVGYTVTEIKGTDFPYTVSKTGDTGSIPANGTAVATFTNTYTKGDLKISKAVNGADASSTQKFEFTLTSIPDGTFVIAGATDQNGNALSTIANGGKFYLTGGQTATIKDLPDDTVCTVTETAVAGYATTVNGNATLTKSATIEAGGVVEIPFINTYSVADLTITKNVVVEDGVSIPGQAFTINVALAAADNAVLASKYDFTKTDANGKSSTGELTVSEGKVSFALKHGEKIVIHDLQLDTKYTVTEAETTYYTGTVAPSGLQTLAADTTVTVTNTYNTGNLTVTKTVEGTHAPKEDQSETFTFTLTLTDANAKVNYKIGENGTLTELPSNGQFTLSDGQIAYIYGIPDGVTYTVTEAQPEGFAYTTKVNGTTGYTATGTANNDPTVAFTNTYKYNDLTITKNVVNQSGELYKDVPDAEFPFTLTLKDANGDKLTGSYNITKSDDTTSIVSLDTPFNLKASESIIIHNLPVGATYTVTEDEVEGFVLVSKTGETGTIKATGDYTAVFNNEYRVGQMTISKEVTGADAPADAEFTFTVELPGTTAEFDYYVIDTETKDPIVVDGADVKGKVVDHGTIKLQHNQTAVIDCIPAGVLYTVTETENPDYNTTKKGDTGIIEAGQTSTAEFTNTYKYSHLTIKKTGMKTNTESAIFTVSNDKDKTFTVVVPNGDSVTIGKLLIGDTYTVSESGSWTWLYAPTPSSPQVVIKEGGSSVEIKNSGTDKWLHDESGVINTYGTSDGTSIN